MFSHQAPQEVAMRFNEAGLQAYLKEIEQFKLLTREQEGDLARRIAKGDSEARAHMIRSNLRLVVHVAMQYGHRGVSLMDLIAEGNIGLMKAVERFKAERQTRFSTYGTWWIRQHIRRALQTCGPTVRVPGYMVELISKWKKVRGQLTEKFSREPTNQEIAKEMDVSEHRLRMIRSALKASATGGASPDMSWVFEGTVQDKHTPRPEQVLFDESDHEMIESCLLAISEREAEILRMRYGLDTGEAMTLEKIGVKMKLTRERIRQIESEALRKLAACMKDRMD
jgi:RNA polymerase primary sigma factor